MKELTIRKRLIITSVVIVLIIMGYGLIGYLAVKNAADTQNLQKYTSGYGIFTLIFLFVALAIVETAFVSILRSIRVSVSTLTAAAKQMAEGDNNIDLKKGRNDEFGVLVDQLIAMNANNQEQDKVVQAIADGDYTVEVQPKSDKDILGHSLKKLVDKNREALQGIDEAACSVMTSATEVASASESLAQGSTEQASAIEEITASIDDVSDKTKKNAQEAKDAATLMRKALDNMEKGNESMREMVDAMNDINVSSESISKIIKVIDDIAFQTNILALNAAVEAARAGDAGMGFAVVAEEVRNLAAKSSQAAAETAELIETSIKKIHSGKTIADETAKALNEVSVVVAESETIVHGIAEASDYQATAIEQIDQAVGQVSMVVQTNSATSQECAAASAELSNQASHMRGLIGVFHIGGNNGGSGARKAYGYDNSFSRKQMTTAERNEQIISLGDGFGKY